MIFNSSGQSDHSSPRYLSNLPKPWPTTLFIFDYEWHLMSEQFIHQSTHEWWARSPKSRTLETKVITITHYCYNLLQSFDHFIQRWIVTFEPWLSGNRCNLRIIHLRLNKSICVSIRLLMNKWVALMLLFILEAYVVELYIVTNGCESCDLNCSSLR